MHHCTITTSADLTSLGVGASLSIYQSIPGRPYAVAAPFQTYKPPFIHRGSHVGATLHALALHLSSLPPRPCLVSKNFRPKVSHRILRHMYGVLNIDKKKLISQFLTKSRDESFKPN